MKKILPLLLASVAVAALADETAVSVNEFGLLRVDSTLENTIVAVPWLQLSGSSTESPVVVSDFVKTANLSNGDRLYAFNNGTGLYEAWEIKNGAWEAIGTVNVDTGSITSPASADTRTLVRGGALWIVRQNPSAGPFYLFGQSSDTAITTSVTVGTASAPVWNLVANPTDAAYSLSKITNPGAADEIYIITDGKPVKYFFKNGSWGTYVYTTRDDGKTVMDWSTAGTTIPRGTGFWYVSKGGSPSFNW